MGKRNGQNVGLLMAAVAATVGTSTARAATLYWDADPTTYPTNGASPFIPTAGVGGPGTWDTSTANWWLPTSAGASSTTFPTAPTNGSYQAWNASLTNTDIADFRGTTGSVTISGTVAASQVNFSTANQSITGGTLILTGGHTINVSGGPNTILSVITGTVGLVKTGGGSQLNLGNANTYTGGTVINGNAGTIAITGDGVNVGDAGGLGAVPTTPGLNVTLNGGTNLVSRTGSVTVHANRGIFTGTGAVGFGGTLTIAGSITGTGTISSTQGGNVTFTNASNNYTGATAISQIATLRIGGGDNRLPTGTELRLQRGSGFGSGFWANFDLTGNSQTVGGLSDSSTANPGDYGRVFNNSAAASASTLTITNAVGNTTYNGIIVDGAANKTVRLVKSTGGVQTLGGRNTYTGGTEITGGTLASGTSTVGSTVSNGTFGTGAVTVRSGGTIELGHSATIADTAALTLDGGSHVKLLFNSGYEAVRTLTIGETTYTWAGTDLFFNTGNNFTGGLGGDNSSYFTTSGGGISVVPEPTTATLVGMMSVGLLMRRRRRDQPMRAVFPIM